MYSTIWKRQPGQLLPRSGLLALLRRTLGKNRKSSPSGGAQCTSRGFNESLPLLVRCRETKVTCERTVAQPYTLSSHSAVSDDFHSSEKETSGQPSLLATGQRYLGLGRNPRRAARQRRVRVTSGRLQPRPAPHRYCGKSGGAAPLREEPAVVLSNQQRAAGAALSTTACAVGCARSRRAAG